jgi:hypothetical protein
MCGCKENTNPCPPNSPAKVSVKWSDISDKPICFNPCTEPLDSLYVLLNRTITVNGDSQQLNSDPNFNVIVPSVLNDLNDVNTLTALPGQVLGFNGLNWNPINFPAFTGWSLLGNDIDNNAVFGSNNNFPINFRINSQPAGIWNTNLNLGIFGQNSSGFNNIIDSRLTLFSDNIFSSGNIQTLATLIAPIRSKGLNTGASIEFIGTTGPSTPTRFGLARITALNVGSNKGTLLFEIDGSTANNARNFTEVMRITDDGRVGVNTGSSIVGSFHINDSIASVLNLTTANNSSDISGLVVTDTGGNISCRLRLRRASQHGGGSSTSFENITDIFEISRGSATNLRIRLNQFGFNTVDDSSLETYTFGHHSNLPSNRTFLRIRAASSLLGSGIIFGHDTLDPTNITTFQTVGASSFDFDGLIGAYRFKKSNVTSFSIKANGVIRLHPLAVEPSGGEDGDMYYNSALNKFRGYVNGMWIDLH